VSRGNDPVRYAKRVERGRNLVYNFLTMTENYDAVAALHRAGNDVREEDGLPGTGWRLIKNAARAAPIFSANFREAVLLIKPQNRRSGAFFILPPRRL
jgi:hypothetical protein